MQGLERTLPVVGLMTQPGHSTAHWVSACMVRWLQAAGATPRESFWDDSPRELRARFKILHGIVFPGGNLELSWDGQFMRTCASLHGLAQQANDAGTVFPILGVCQGLQVLASLSAAQPWSKLRSRTDARHYRNRLSAIRRSSALFSGLTASQIRLLRTGDSIPDNHSYALSPDTLSRTPGQKTDRPFVASLESAAYPFMALQWHPEKPAFMHSDESVPHGRDIITVCQTIAHNFVDLARRCDHPELTAANAKLLVDNLTAGHPHRRVESGDGVVRVHK